MIIHGDNVNTGGALVLLTELVRRAAVAGVETVVFCSALNEQEITSTAQYPVDIKDSSRWNLLRVPKAGPVLYFGNLPPIRRVKNSAVYVHNAYLTLSIYELLKGAMLRRFSWKYLLIGVYFRIYCSSCDVVLVQTKTMLDAMRRISSVPVLPMPFYSVNVLSRTAYTEKTTSFCAVGLPSAHKCYDEFLDAIDRLVAEEREFAVEVTIPIDTLNMERIRKIDDVNLRAGRLVIRNHGLVTRDIVEAIYRRSRSLVFPSLRESFGLPLIEAAEHGLTIFAPELPFVEDVVDGFLAINPTSSRSMCEVLGKWLDQGCPVQKPRLKVEDCGDELLRSNWTMLSKKKINPSSAGESKCGDKRA